jgi:chemotaxis protein histidine kinase CheA
MSAQIEMNNNFGSTFSKGGFNAQMYVSEQLTRQLINNTQDVAIRCVQVLASKFNFDASEAIEMLGLNMIKLERKAPMKAKVSKPAKIQAPKSAFPLPYNGELNEACCYALRQNNGLFTQCTGTRKGENSFCKGCASQMQKVGAEMPEYGTIQQRMAVGIFEYVDPKGRKPIAYAKIMKKYKVTEEQVKEEAGKLNMIINPEHFAVPEETKRGRPSSKTGEKVPKEKGVKGRPKKSKKVLQIEGDDDDIFAALVAEANEVEEEDIVLTGKKKGGKSDEEKAKEREAERLQKEQEKKEKEAKRLAEKAEKEAKLAAEKAEKEAKKKAEEEARLAKKAAEEAEKQAKKEAAEKAKAEKEAKLAAEKAAKEAKKAEKSSKKSVEKAEEKDEEEEPDVVKKIEFEGKKYLKSKKTGIIYDYKQYAKNGEQVVVGKWSESTNKIVFDDAEESEDEYDE